MYRKILVGYDTSDQAKDAFALGETLAEASGATLVAEAIASGDPARGLQTSGQEIEADLILVGSAHHGRLGQAVAGSVGLELLHGSPCAVGIAPRGYRERQPACLGAIVVGFNGSAEFRQALLAATELCGKTGARLKLVAVAEPPAAGVGMAGVSPGWYELKQTIEEDLRERLREAREAVPDGVDVETSLIAGDPAAALRGAGTTPGSLLLVGSRAYGPLRRVLLGSVSSKLIRSAPCPLIVHPRGMNAAHDSPIRAEAEAVLGAPRAD